MILHLIFKIEFSKLDLHLKINRENMQEALLYNPNKL